MKIEFDKATRRKHRVALKAVFLSYEGLLRAAKNARKEYLDSIRERHFNEIVKYQFNNKYSPQFQTYKLDAIAENNITAIEAYLKISNFEISVLKRRVRAAHLARAYYYGTPYAKVEKDKTNEAVRESDIRSAMMEALGTGPDLFPALEGLRTWLKDVHTKEKQDDIRREALWARIEKMRRDLKPISSEKGFVQVLPATTVTFPFEQTLKNFPVLPEGEE